ncbi:hypothetical protein ATM97_11185 [Nocardia sp. MH4]|nr:hypothetical protein [Nocardia sp. MH4]
MCCGEGRALLEAEERFAQEFTSADVTLIGFGLVGFFRARPRTERLRLSTASAATWTPDRPADLRLVTARRRLAQREPSKSGVFAPSARLGRRPGELASNLCP